MKNILIVLAFIISANTFAQTPLISCTTCVESVEDLRGLSSTAVETGSIVYTKSYYLQNIGVPNYEANLGGSNVYRKIGTTADAYLMNEIDDGGSTIIGVNGSVYKMNDTDDVNAKQFGIKGDGVFDDTLFLENYAKYCKEKNKKFVINKSDRCKITRDLDLRGIDIININGEIIGSSLSTTEITTGSGSNNGTRTNLFVNKIQAIKLIITGTVHSSITINSAENVELYGNGKDDNDYHSVAYNRFYLGDIDTLRINCSRSEEQEGWINENKFYGGNIKDLSIVGTYPCNNNIFYGTMFEDFTGNFEKGYSNYFYDVRFEGTLNLNFSKGVFNTRFFQSYYQFESDFFKKRNLVGWQINDLGQLNGVEHQVDLLYKDKTVFEINPTMTDGLSTSTFLYDYAMKPTKIELTSSAAYDYFYDSGIFKLTGNPMAIKISSDQNFFDPHLYLYDENGNKIDENPNSYIENGLVIVDPIVNNTDLGGSWFNDPDHAIGDPENESRFRFNGNIAPSNTGEAIFPIFPKGRVFYARLRVRVGSVPSAQTERSFNHFSISIIESKDDNTVIGKIIPN